jgi:hypothetical protein
MLSPESRLPSWIMISIIGPQDWRIGLVHDNLQHGLRFQLKILCFFGGNVTLIFIEVSSYFVCIKTMFI